MKNKFKLAIALGVVAFMTTPAFATTVCFVNEAEKNFQNFDQMMMVYSYHQAQDSLQCSDKANIQKGLTAVSISFGLSGIIAGCTGVGLPVTVVFELGVVGIQAIDMYVANLPCDNDTPEQNIKLMVDEAVCQALERNGQKCSSSLK